MESLGLNFLNHCFGQVVNTYQKHDNQKFDKHSAIADDKSLTAKSLSANMDALVFDKFSYQSLAGQNTNAISISKKHVNFKS